MDESLIPLTPEETAGWGVRTKGKAASPTITSALEARLNEAMAQPDRERQEIFEYLKEFRRQKRLGKKLERQATAAEEK